MFVDLKTASCVVHCLLSSHSLNINLFTGKLSVDIEYQNTKVQNKIYGKYQKIVKAICTMEKILLNLAECLPY